MDLSTVVGSVGLRAPVMTASGTAGHGAEFAHYLDPASLGAVVVKSMKAGPWAGNPAPRVHPTAAGMINSVGLQGQGVGHWLEHELPELAATGATVVATARTPSTAMRMRFMLPPCAQVPRWGRTSYVGNLSMSRMPRPTRGGGAAGSAESAPGSVRRAWLAMKSVPTSSI